MIYVLVTCYLEDLTDVKSFMIPQGLKIDENYGLRENNGKVTFRGSVSNSDSFDTIISSLACGMFDFCEISSDW